MPRVNLHHQLAALLLSALASGCAGIDANIDVALSAPTKLGAVARVHLWELDPAHLTHEATVIATRNVVLEDDAEQIVAFGAHLEHEMRYYFTVEPHASTSCVVYRDVEDAQLFEGSAPPGQIDLRLSAEELEGCSPEE